MLRFFSRRPTRTTRRVRLSLETLEGRAVPAALLDFGASSEEASTGREITPVDRPMEIIAILVGQIQSGVDGSGETPQDDPTSSDALSYNFSGIDGPASGIVVNKLRGTLNASPDDGAESGFVKIYCAPGDPSVAPEPTTAG